MLECENSEEILSIELDGKRLAAVFHHASSRDLVIFCHGFRGTRIGPSRFFVRTARQLAHRQICSLRFDHQGSGDSAGDFMDSSFDDWVASIVGLANRYIGLGYRIGLVGQSMGGSAAIAAAALLGDRLSSAVLWAPDPSVDSYAETDDWSEEGGERVQAQYWREAHGAGLIDHYRDLTCPTLVFVPTDDVYVSEENQLALIESAGKNHRVVPLPGWVHSGWSYDQATRVIDESVMFLAEGFGRRG